MKKPAKRKPKPKRRRHGASRDQTDPRQPRRAALAVYAVDDRATLALLLMPFIIVCTALIGSQATRSALSLLPSQPVWSVAAYRPVASALRDRTVQTVALPGAQPAYPPLPPTIAVRPTTATVAAQNLRGQSLVPRYPPSAPWLRSVTSRRRAAAVPIPVAAYPPPRPTWDSRSRSVHGPALRARRVGPAPVDPPTAPLTGSTGRERRSWSTHAALDVLAPAVPPVGPHRAVEQTSVLVPAWATLSYPPPTLGGVAPTAGGAVPWTAPATPWGKLQAGPPPIDPGRLTAPHQAGGVCRPVLSVRAAYASLGRRPRGFLGPRFAPADPALFGRRLAAVARAQTGRLVIYSARYQSLAYPMGDIDPLFGACTDLVIRAYRTLGIDLQELVHRAGVGSGDRSIDHRRTETLRRFFAKYGTSLPVTDYPEAFKPGDIVTYRRPYGRMTNAHIAIVSDVLAPSGRPMVVHNRGWGPQLEDALFADPITGHYRYAGPAVASAKLRRAAAIAAGRAGAAILAVLHQEPIDPEA